ncbi:transposase [Poseidonibacter antarcticus]|uniref:transposase n=1 Tax=Poseidonibacter antarcticus TaxID=2478538 RepID=UPI0013CF1F61|nr:transposase [Poseidonibacter antarcticus]
MKVASTVLRRGSDCEVASLSDYITKKLQQAPTQKEKDEILDALKNSSIVAWSHINLFGIYDFQSYSKRIHRLIALEETKGFMNTISPEK